MKEAGETRYANETGKRDDETGEMRRNNEHR